MDHFDSPQTGGTINRQMTFVGTLPDGGLVYFADAGTFDNPGLHTWHGDKHERFVPGADDAMAGLRVEIENAINRHSAENGSGTPDFVLAHFLMDSLAAFDKATLAREAWHGHTVNVAPTRPNWPKDMTVMHEGVEHVLFMEGNITSDEKPFSVGLTRAARGKGEPARWTRDFHTFDQAKAYFERQVSTRSTQPLIVTVSEGDPHYQNRGRTFSDDATARARAELDNEFPIEPTITGGDQDGDPPFEAPGNGPGGLGNPMGV